MNTENETKKPNPFDVWWSTIPPACNSSKMDCYAAWHASREALASEAGKTDEELVEIWHTEFMNQNGPWKSPDERKLNAVRAIRQALLPDIAKRQVGVTVEELMKVYIEAYRNTPEGYASSRHQYGTQDVLDRLGVEAEKENEELVKLRDFYNQIVKELGDDLVLKRIATANKKISELEAEVANLNIEADKYMTRAHAAENQLAARLGGNTVVTPWQPTTPEPPAEKWAAEKAAPEIPKDFSDALNDVRTGNVMPLDVVFTREKPEPELVPLEAKDLNPGDAFRPVQTGNKRNCYWMVPAAVNSNGIVLNGQWRPWKELMCYERTQDNGKTWQPCSKVKGGQP